MTKTVYALAALLLATSAAGAQTITKQKFSEFLAKGFPQASPCGTTEFILILQNGELRALPCSPLVRGPEGATQNNIAVFDGIDGKKLKDGGRSLPSGNIVGTTDTQTITNKTLDWNNNTFLNFPGAGLSIPPDCYGPNEALRYQAGVGWSCGIFAAVSSGSFLLNGAGDLLLNANGDFLLN